MRTVSISDTALKVPLGGIRFYHGSTTWDYRLRDWPASRLAEVLFSHQYTYPYNFLRLSSLFQSVVSDVSNGKDYSIAKAPPSLSVPNSSPGVLVETKPRGYSPLSIGTFQIHGSCCPFTQFSVHAPSFFHPLVTFHYTIGNVTKLRSFSFQYGWTTPFRRRHRPGNIGAIPNHRKDGTDGR